jgi:hypothetical protein
MSHIDSGGDPNSVKAGRELADISIPALVHHGLYLVIVCVAVWFAMAGMLKLVLGKLADRDPQVSAIARPAGEAPPEPRLLTNEPLNLQQFRDREAQTIGHYGYVDQAADTVRLPIDHAKELLLQRGLPVRAGQPVAAPVAPTAPAAPAPAPRSGGH